MRRRGGGSCSKRPGIRSRLTRRGSRSTSPIRGRLPRLRGPAGLAEGRARWRSRRKSGLILGADTVCAVGGQILNKPIDRTDAERMIRLQEGQDTDVISGICLFRGDRHEWIGAVEVSIVRFKPLSDQRADEYLDSGRWQGKSGGYGVQDRDPFVAVVRGSFSNVVGLPMERLASLLETYPRLIELSWPSE